MTRNDQSASATILRFPVGGRGGVKSMGQGGTVRTLPPVEPVPHIVFGSGWYHEAAIEEERTRHN